VGKYTIWQPLKEHVQYSISSAQMTSAGSFEFLLAAKVENETVQRFFFGTKKNE
jgi:hypothetical protein